MAQKSENSRKIAAKISEGMQGNGIFRNSYKIDAVRVRVAPILCGICQILALSAEYRLFFYASNKDSAVITDWNASE